MNQSSFRRGNLLELAGESLQLSTRKHGGFPPQKGQETLLVLRRKPGDAIVINGCIRIVLLAVEGERTKWGIEAPPDVIVVREELLEPEYIATHPEPKRRGND